MSIVFLINAEHDLVVSLWHGPTSYTQWMESIRSMIAERAFPQTHRFLVDLRLGFADDSIQNDQLATAASLLFSASGPDTNRKVAIVAGERDFNKLKIFERSMTTSSISVIVFNHFSSACTWLGVDSESAETISRSLLQRIRTTDQAKL